MRLDSQTRSRAATPTEEDADQAQTMRLAAQLRALLRSAPSDDRTSVVPGLLAVLRRGFDPVAHVPSSPLATLLRERSWVGRDELAAALTSGVSLSAVGACLDTILLAHADDAETPASAAEAMPVSAESYFQRFKPKSAHALCGYMFQRNDIAFNCRTCQLDETCVLCLKCYQNGNHEGHDIYFHRTAPGGMCDCGDAEAWAPDGFCVNHGHHLDAQGMQGNAEGEDDTPALPAMLVRTADALFDQIVHFFVEMAQASRDVFDPESADRIGRQQLAAERIPTEGSDPSGTAAAAVPSLSLRFHVRICNDDVHSDEDLIGSLSKKRILDARRLVRGIDSNGSELVAMNVSLRDALALMRDLKNEGWHVAVVTDRHIRDEDVLIQVIQWVKALCALSQPLHQLFCDKLFTSTHPLSAPKEPIQVMFRSDPYFRKEITVVLYELYLKLQSEKDPKLKFSLVFLKVYNRLMVQYFCGIGTRDESLFQYGVQIFTTPSIVSQLAKLGLLDILLDTMHTSLELAKTSTPRGATYLAVSSPSAHRRLSTRTLDCDHSILKFKRYSFVVDNFGYVMNIPAMSSELLLQVPLLRKWLEALRQMQGLDPQVRIQDGHAHVTYETQLWFSAFNFHSYISRLMTIVCKALRQHEGAVEQKTVMVQNVMTSFWEELDLVMGGTDSGQVATHTPTFGFGVTAPFAERIVKFDVASQPVSFHYPLHGFLANFLLENLYYGPGVTDWKTFIEDSLRYIDTNGDTERDMDVSGDEFSSDGTEQANEESRRGKKLMLVYGMMEFPLRTLVLCAQIQCGLWIRNGQSMHRQMLHYTNPPLCSELRDLDLLLVQIGASVIGFPQFLGVYFDRFGVMEWLHSWWSSSGGSESRDDDRGRSSTFPMGEEKLVSVLEGALLQLIWMVTELPPPLVEIEERDVWLRREIVHRLSQHPCRLSELLDQTGFMTSTPFGGVSSPQGNEHLARLERILADVADVQVKISGSGDDYSRSNSGTHGGDDGDADAFGSDGGNTGGGSGMEPNKYVLKQECYREYDPSFYHLARSAHEKAQFARQEALFKHWKAEDAPIPLVHQLPPAHASFAGVRLLVLEKGLLGILRVVLEDSTTESAMPRRTNVMVVTRTIHLVNLVTLVLKQGHNGSALPVVVDTKRRRVLSLLRSGPNAFEESDTIRSSRSKRYKREQGSDSDLDVQMSSDDQGDTSEVEDGSIVALLVTLAKDQVKHDFDTSKSTISAIYWILNELASLDNAIQRFTQENVWQGMKKSHDHAVESGLSKAQLKKLHQERAIAAMRAKQNAFASSSLFAEMDEMDEDEDDDMANEQFDGAASNGSGLSSAETIVYRPPPPPECIICTQKKKHEPVMYIGHAQTSQVSVHALQEKPFPAPPLAEVFPPSMFLTLCGHAVHLQCWKKYFESVRALSRFNLEHSQSNVAYDAHYGEFVCPMCQSLSSMLVPHVASSGVLTMEQQQRDRDAMEHVFQAKQDTASVLDWLQHGLPDRLESMQTADDEDEMDLDDVAMGGRAPHQSQERERRRHSTKRGQWMEEEMTSEGEGAGDEDGNEDVDEDGERYGDEEDEEGGYGREDEDDMEEEDEESVAIAMERRAQHMGRRQGDVRAMKQFAVSFLEALARFQPEMTHVASTIAAIKKSSLCRGPQLAHLMWSAVASTCASAQLSGVSSVIFALESARAPPRRHRTPPPRSRRSPSPNPLGSDGVTKEESSSPTRSTNFSSLRITSLLNPPLPSLASRLAVALPESLENHLDPFSPKDDGKLNCLLRALSRVHLVFRHGQRQEMFTTIGRPLQQQLRLALEPETWQEALARGAPPVLGQPLLSQDLLYLCVALCSSVAASKSEILVTIRALCVLHMAQVLLQIARIPPHEQDEEDDVDEDVDGEDSENDADQDQGQVQSDDKEGAGESEMETENGHSHSHSERQARRRRRGMTRALRQLLASLSEAAGVAEVARANGVEYAPPRGSQLLAIFQSSALTFMRQTTLLLRGFFRGAADPDAAHYANFVSSLRLSTNFDAMSQQLGLPTVKQVVQDPALMAYLVAAAAQVRTARTGLSAEMATDEAEAMTSLALVQAQRNLAQLPALPLRGVAAAESVAGVRHLYYATVRLARLAPLYTDLHSEVLAHCRCPRTGKFVENPAICLVCEAVLCAGTDCCRRARDAMGACTAHAVACGYGAGLFFLMRSSSVLLVFGPRSSYFGSPYLDMFGEEDINLRRGRPLYLNGNRMRALLTLYATHQLANEVARNRQTSDQYIRNNYY